MGDVQRIINPKFDNELSGLASRSYILPSRSPNLNSPQTNSTVVITDKNRFPRPEDISKKKGFSGL